MSADALTADEIATLDQALFELAKNGIGEVGLEIGTDIGLPRHAFIRIPKSMRRKTIARMALASYLSAGHTEDDRYEPDEEDKFEDIVGMKGWAEITSYVRVGQFAKDPDANVDIDMVISQPATRQMVREFICANLGHCNESRLDSKHVPWVIAVRFWAVVAGLVAEVHNREFIEVDTPSADDVANVPGMEAIEREVISSRERSLLFCAARAYNWKKTNHCTGGRMASGFVRKVMGDLWAEGGDRKDRDSANEKVTSAFYSATHAVSVHAALATFAPSNADHWAEYDVAYGALFEPKVGLSVSLRLKGKDAVAGASQVADSIRVLGILMSEQMTPFLANRAQIDALMAAYKEVLRGGMSVHVGANWYFRGHPAAGVAMQFNQKDEAWAALAQELATISQVYYPNYAISRSPALANLHAQNQDGSIASTWGLLYAQKKAARADQIIAALDIMRGASATGAVALLTSKSEDDVALGVEAINGILRRDAASINAVLGEDTVVPKLLVRAEALTRAEKSHGAEWKPAAAAAAAAAIPPTA